MPEAPDAVKIMGCDAANGTYYQLCSDDRGICQVYAAWSIAGSREAEDHHATGPWRSTNVPVGPCGSSFAIATIASVPSSTLCVPLCPLRSVAV
jgi:hypothetical protein